MTILTAARSVLTASLFALVAAGCSGTADADSASAALTATEGGERAEGRAFGRGPGHGHGRGMMGRLDRDGDGTIRVAELPEPMQARMGEADANHDGVLSADEMRAHREAQHALRFARLDANSDGAVTADEAGERWDHLRRADADGDGRLTRAELDASRPGFGRGGRHGQGMRGAPDPARMMARLDRDGDGTVRVNELPERMLARMGDVDANHDGVVAQEELAAAMARHHAERVARHPETAPAPAQQ